MNLCVCLFLSSLSLAPNRPALAVINIKVNFMFLARLHYLCIVFHARDVERDAGMARFRSGGLWWHEMFYGCVSLVKRGV